MYKLTIQNVIDFTEYWILKNADSYYTSEIPEPEEEDVLRYFNLLHETSSSAKTKQNPT